MNNIIDISRISSSVSGRTGAVERNIDSNVFELKLECASFRIFSDNRLSSVVTAGDKISVSGKTDEISSVDASFTISENVTEKDISRQIVALIFAICRFPIKTDETHVPQVFEGNKAIPVR